jgi:hypothetical protein
MNTTTRAKLITAGLLAAAVSVLPACSTQVSGTAVEPAAAAPATTTAAAPYSNPVPETTAPRMKPIVAPEYEELANTVDEAAEWFANFWVANQGGPLGVDIVQFDRIEGAPCLPDNGVSVNSAWICPNDPVKRSIAVYLPNTQKYVWEKGGESAVFWLVGHEASHYGLVDLDLSVDTGGNLEELRATCGAGSFVATVARERGLDAEAELNNADKALRFVEETDALKDGANMKYEACTTYVHPSMR